MTEKLKSCPFCGGEAHISKMGYPHWVYCENCGAKVHGRVTGERAGEKASVKAWNRRVEQAGWIKTSERLPVKCEDVLVWEPMSEEVKLGYRTPDGLWETVDYGFFDDSEIPYWMPLPELPEEVEE